MNLQRSGCTIIEEECSDLGITVYEAAHLADNRG